MEASINALVSQPMVPLLRTAIRSLKLVLLYVCYTSGLGHREEIFETHLSGLTYDFGTLANQTK